MKAYSYPKDLLTSIKEHWKPVPDNRFDLPEEGVLLRLLETCYHASLRTTEQRAVQCVVAYASISQVPDGVLRLTNRTVVLSDTELVRLSPVTKRGQTVIGCYDSDGWLQIWGFFEYASAWVQYASGDPSAVLVQPSDFPPDCLTITIEGPGRLSISQGKTGLVRLRDGRITFPQEQLLHTTRNPLGAFLNELVVDLRSSIPGNDSSSSTVSAIEHSSLLDTYTTCVLAILERIRLRQHGGSVVISRTPIDEELVHITYTVSEHAGLSGEILAYNTVINALQKLEMEANSVRERSTVISEPAMRHASQQLIRGISQISFLAAVDGAVLLDAHLRIKGFGVRFPMLLPPGTTALDAVTGIEHLCDQWGLRHQSVFSICQKCEHAIGWIVSQDGGVKVVKATDGRLMFWDSVLD